MTRAQRRPSKSERYLEGIESIFWLVPMGFVVLGAALGAVAFYLSTSVFATGCMRFMRIARFGQRGPLRISSKMTTPARAASAWKGAKAEALESSRTNQCSELSTCDPSIRLMQAGGKKFTRAGLPGCFPFRECKGNNISGVPRFLGSAPFDRPRFDRF